MAEWRRALVAGVLPEGFTMFDEQLSPDIDEKAIRRDDPAEMVLAIAHAKADKVQDQRLVCRARAPAVLFHSIAEHCHHSIEHDLG